MEPIQINALLLVEDNASSYALFMKAFGDFFEDTYDLKLFESGTSMFKFLNELLTDPLAIEPSVILLKIDPKEKDRLKTLRALKLSDKFKIYPVIVFSDSKDQELVDACYDLHANAFVYRDPDPEEFYQSIQNLLGFWIKVVLPPITQQDY